MTREEYEAYIEELKERGYKFCGNDNNYKIYYYKVIEYRKNEDGDSRAVCQLLFYPYELKDNCSGYVYYFVEPLVTISRNIEERLDFNVCHPKRSIDECELIAIEFMEFVDMNIKVPQEDGD